jgi:hypothetical protein
VSRRRISRAGPLLLLVIVAACSGGDGDGAEADGSELGQTSPTVPPEPPPVPAESPAGTGVVVIGGTNATFSVSACELEQAPAADGTGELLRVTGAGTRANGVPFSVEITRVATDEADTTFTDSVTYTDTARILQLQRFELDGEVSDLRDPDARSTLLRVRPEGVAAAGIAGPPGTTAPDGPGLVGFAVDATCSAG